jgi:hypothetical protein
MRNNAARSSQEIMRSKAVHVETTATNLCVVFLDRLTLRLSSNLSTSTFPMPLRTSRECELSLSRGRRWSTRGERLDPPWRFKCELVIGSGRPRRAEIPSGFAGVFVARGVARSGRPNFRETNLSRCYLYESKESYDYGTYPIARHNIA